MAHRQLAAVFAVLALFGAGLLLASCGGDDGEPAGATAVETRTGTTTAATEATTEATPTTEATITTEATTTTETASPPTAPTEIRIVVAGGAPKGGIVRESVKKGDRVVLVVSSDVADEIHLHGYDVSRDVAAGGTVRLPFKATIPGRFEVELEDRGVQIADISVTT